MRKKRILIDLDGVLNTYKGEFNSEFIPPINEGAEEFVKIIAEIFELTLFTTRPKEKAQRWLEENRINEYFSNVTNKKEPCYLIIDDRSITYDGDYNKILEKIMNFNVWWKK